MPKLNQRLVPKLVAAIQDGDVDAARALLDAGADPNGTAGYNAKPLSVATSLVRQPEAREALTRLLLERGADPNDRGPYNFDNRPIFYAAHCGYAPEVRLLLDAGGFPRDTQGAPARNSDGSTLLALGANSGLRWLVERALVEGCRADEIDNHGSTALHYATVVHGVIPHPDKDTAGLITLLLAQGAPLEHRRPGDWGTALHWALWFGDPAAVRTLVAHGAGLEARTDRSGMTPLHAGARYGTAEAVQAALDLGADVHASDNQGRTPLHHAAMRHPSAASADVLQVLLAHGADPDARDAVGLTPLDTLVQALKEDPASSPAQAEALAALAARATDAQLQAIALPKGETLLHLAARQGSVALVQAGLARGLAVDATDSSGWTPLHLAAAHGAVAVSEALCAGGASTSKVTKKARKLGGVAFEPKLDAAALAARAAPPS